MELAQRKFFLCVDYGNVKAGERCGSMKYIDKTYLDADGFLGKKPINSHHSRPVLLC